MRTTKTSNGLRVHAVAGTYVVMLGFDLPKHDCPGLLGFTIHRTDLTENEAYYLTGMKAFETTEPGFTAGSHYSTDDHPVQSYQWADYSAKPGHQYRYAVSARKGTPEALTIHATTVVEVRTESPGADAQEVYFNRGVAGSQEYTRRFGDRAPDKVSHGRAFEWLSRGLWEALEAYLRSCVPGVDALRIAAYEFSYDRLLEVVKEVRDTGVDVQIVYDARKDVPGKKNVARVKANGLGAKQVSFKRTKNKSYISHNKFIVKISGGRPESVWTGGTNFSEGGIFGHSNVAHVVHDPAVAQSFLDYWDELAADPTNDDLEPKVETLSPDPVGRPSVGTTVLFSPRSTLNALDWYADLALQATDGLFMTFAFGMNDLFKNAYENGKAPLRIALMEKKTVAYKDKAKQKAEEKKIQALRNMPENTFAIGEFIHTNAIEGWVKERLSGLNTHVKYVHNKFMLIDPLTDDPIVVAGSANFSPASTTANDENMLVVRGDTRVADIYLGEFMRLYTHHAFRESRQWAKKTDTAPKWLRTDDWWKDYYGNTPRSTRRRYFARSQGT